MDPKDLTHTTGTLATTITLADIKRAIALLAREPDPTLTRIEVGADRLEGLMRAALPAERLAWRWGIKTSPGVATFGQVPVYLFPLQPGLLRFVYASGREEEW